MFLCVLLWLAPLPSQGVYALVVYCFVSWHTLTQKHKQFVLGDEVEPLSIPEEPDYLAAMSNLSTSRHKMDPQVTDYK